MNNVNRKILLVTTGFLLALSAAGCTSGGADTSQNDGSSSAGGSGTNHAPTISGAPAAAVNVEQPWSFVPSASDPDGDTLAFTIENAPSWATFVSSTGVLSGTPHDADIGLYDDIHVLVSDGSLSDSFGPFSVEVTQVALGSLTVVWSLPSQYDDGSSLTGHIDGVNLYYGVSQGNYGTRSKLRT